MSFYDPLEFGKLYTAKYLKESGIIANSRSLGSLYRLVSRPDKAGTEEDVNVGLPAYRGQAGEVYEVRALNHNMLAVGGEYSSSQTATEIIAAPGEGKQIVITTVAIRSIANSGKAYLSNGILNAFHTYFESQYASSSNNLDVAVGENLAITLTSTQGSNDMYVGVAYYIEAV